MKTKNIFKALAFAILMPALLLNTSCNSDITNDENIDEKGYALPVTVNVTRQGADPATKATYTDNGDGTGSLGFSAGDKLFVRGKNDPSGAGQFAGTLDYDAGSGKFSGTIYTENSFSGTAEQLFSVDPAYLGNKVLAILLPAGYEDYGWVSIIGSGYGAVVSENTNYTLATSKAAGVEQFSLEKAYSYSSGFALSPTSAILSFTITGLTPETNVDVSLKNYYYTISNTITTDDSGNATFAAGVEEEGNFDLKDFTLTVDGKPITLVNSEVVLKAGKIYNITRSAAPAYTLLSAATTADYGKVVCSDGHLHDAKTAVPAGCTAVGILGKVTSTGHGLILALQDATSQSWNTINGWSSVESYAGTTLKQLPDDAARGSLPSYTTLGSTPVSNWCVAQKSDYEAIFTNLGSTKVYDGSTTYDDHVNAFITTDVGGSALIMSTDINDRYWSATSFSDGNAWYCRSAWWGIGANSLSSYIRPVLAF